MYNHVRHVLCVTYPPPPPATIEVPPEKRRKLIGSGGHRIQALVSETGAEVHTISDKQMSVFAPTSEAMEDLMERIEAILQEEEEREVMQKTCFRYWECRQLMELPSYLSPLSLPLSTASDIRTVHVHTPYMCVFLCRSLRWVLFIQQL